MKIHQMSYYQGTCLLNTTQENTTSKNMVEVQKHFGNDLGVDIEISEIVKFHMNLQEKGY